jgi:hypothetical protein
MNEPARPTTRHERDRALDRLRSITTGTAIAATVASAGFGTLAALTFSGTSTDAANGSDTGGGVVSQVGNTQTGSGTTSGTTYGRSGPAATLAPLQAVQVPVTSTRHKSRVSSGGSH